MENKHFVYVYERFKSIQLERLNDTMFNQVEPNQNSKQCLHLDGILDLPGGILDAFT